MIVVQISYGFGNQFFQYLQAVELSKKFPNETIKLETNHFKNQLHSFDKREYQLSFFDNLEFKIVDSEFFQDFFNFRKKSLRRIWQIKNYIFFNKDNYFIIKDDTNKFIVFLSYLFKKKYYIGGWNSKHYSIINVRNEFKKLNISKETKNNYINTRWIDKIKNTNSVAICVRRSDYAKFGMSSNLDYFNKAISFFNKKFSNNNFFIFSDDIKWCKNNFKQTNNKYFIDTNQDVPLEDLLLISYCKHAIISKSTFNLLACYINENPKKIIITDKNWNIDFKIDFQTLLVNKYFRVMSEQKK
tara:strand:- start:240 stop:1139 length:900 start_codon:yes stop_codon:yes gene_type:complete